MRAASVAQCGLHQVGPLGDDAFALLGTGFCGAFTTYSAFAVKTHEHGLRGGTTYAVATVGLALAACGGGYLLGLSGLVVIAHGSSSRVAIANATRMAARGVEHRLVERLAARLPTQASQLYGINLVNLMKLLTPGKDGQLVLDLDDVVQRGMTVTRDGELLWPPPAIQVSAAAKPAATASAP